MIRLPVVLLMLVLGAPGAWALGLRSGEHSDRVRLVVEIPVGAVWRLGRSAEGYELRLDGVAERHNVGGVFARIGRDRLRGLSAEPGRLGLRLACDPCHARAFLWREDRLVIDLVDGPPSAASRFERALDAPEPVGAPEPMPGPVPSRSRLLPPVFGVAYPGTSPDPPMPVLPDLPTLPAPTPGVAGLDTARRAMLEGVARAAGQGLLDPAGEIDRQVERDWATAPLPTPTTPPPALAAARPGLAAQTGFDAGLAIATAVPEEDATCPAPGWFDIAGWVDPGAGFAAGLVARRDAMAGEFGRVPAGAPEALARFYIHHGFGQEARRVLAAQPETTRERVWLDLLAGLVDGPVAAPGPLADTQDCLGPAALWGALARGTLTGMSERARTAATAAFRSLPDPLRGHLGERLARLFAEAGDPRGADEILGRAEAAPTGGTYEARRADAEIAARLEGPEAEIETLQETAERDTRLTPEGLSRLIGLMLEEGREVPGGLLELARALRFEHRGQPGAAALLRVEARALIATGLHDAALELVAASDLPEQEALALRGAAVTAMARDLDEAAFVERAFAPLPSLLPPEAENALAERLLATGFAEAALARIASPAQGSAADGRRLLRAEAELALGWVDRALATIEGAETPEAEALRKRIAKVELTAPPATESESDVREPPAPPLAEPNGIDPTLAWRQGDWESLARSGDPLLEAASEAARRPVAPIQAEHSLAAGRALVEEARAARSLATDLLSRFTLDADADADGE